MEFGTLLRETRLRCGLDQATLARRANTTQTYVSRVERSSVSPSLSTMRRFMHAMGQQLTLTVQPLPVGNVRLDDLRADGQLTPQERVQETMELSEFLTGVAEKGRRGSR
jgi:transcriptional regulator with XRE-family HTH domain